jgi:hypothetical protein
MSEQHLAQFEREWDAAFFPALAEDRHEQVVVIDVAHLRRQRLLNPHTRVEHKRDERVQPAGNQALWLPGEQCGHLFVRERRQDALLQLEQGQFQALGVMPFLVQPTQKAFSALM